MSKNLMKVTGKWLRQCYLWLKEEDAGCCSLLFDSTNLHDLYVCVGWRKVDVDDGPGETVRVGNSTFETRKSHEEWRVYWKIGQQSFNACMQTDLDIDFEMPYNTEAYCRKMNAEMSADERKCGKYCVGDVYDTSEEIEIRPNLTTPVGYRDWNALASYVRKTARKVARYAKEVDVLEKE